MTGSAPDLERFTPADGGEPHKDAAGARAQRRELALAVVACAGAAGIALFVAARTWGVTLTQRPAPLAAQEVLHSGGSLTPLLPALALVSLAGAGALLATRGLGRRAVGVLLGGSGLGIVAAALLAWPDVDGGRVGWPVAAAAAGLVVAAVGVRAFVRGRGWPAMGTRYERATPRVTQGGLWEAIERGEDPTR